jgi:VCBS repeat-containing protein
MKLLMGFIILLVALVAVTGCTQTASPSAQTTTATTAPVTEVTTAATTAATVATMAPNTTETMVANMTAPAGNVTAPAENVTAVAENVTTAATATVAPTLTPASMVTTIHITSAGFTPQTDVVLPGTGINFVNNDNVSHSIMTIGNNTGMFNSGAIVPNGGFSYTFSENSGTFVYALADNTTVTGTIIVQAFSNTNHSD